MEIGGILPTLILNPSRLYVLFFVFFYSLAAHDDVRKQTQVSDVGEWGLGVSTVMSSSMDSGR
jgi:hypothetical protein